MDEHRQQAFEFAQETVKQLLTLATAIFALTLTFLKDVAAGEPAVELLYWAWALYIVSVVCGVATLMTLAGNLEKPHKGGQPTIYAKNTTVAAGLQIATFFAALIVTLIFGAKAT